MADLNLIQIKMLSALYNAKIPSSPYLGLRKNPSIVGLALAKRGLVRVAGLHPRYLFEITELGKSALDDLRKAAEVKRG